MTLKALDRRAVCSAAWGSVYVDNLPIPAAPVAGLFPGLWSPCGGRGSPTTRRHLHPAAGVSYGPLGTFRRGEPEQPRAVDNGGAVVADPGQMPGDGVPLALGQLMPRVQPSQPAAHRLDFGGEVGGKVDG